MNRTAHTDDILDEIEARGYNVSLDGPDVRITTPAYRWTVRCYTNERDPYGTPVDREMFHGASAREALANALAWITGQ